jgi:hypothetical protein
MSIFTTEVLNPIEEAMNGKTLQIPIHLDRVKEIFAIRKNIYTVILGGSGSGKTSFVDDTFVLKPYELWRKWKHDTDVTFKVLYRSMERSRSQKLVKWTCWKLYQDYGVLLDSDALLGYKKSNFNKETTWKAIVACRDWADELLDFVDIRDGRTTPEQYNDWVTGHALRTGTLFISDSYGVYNAKFPGQYIDTFSEDKFIKLKTGDKELICRYKFNDKDYTIRQGEKRYFADKPKEITIVLADHLGKFNVESGLSEKQTIDKASKYNSDFRDVLSYSPIAVSQINREISNIHRIKFSDGDLSPQIEDAKGSSNMIEDSDLVLSIFNPFRYKAYDDNGMYKGYNIRDQMVNPQGYNRYRLLSILKNSYGIDDVDFGLKFLGEVNDFTTLPRPGIDNSITHELQKVYTEIQQGK